MDIFILSAILIVISIIAGSIIDSIFDSVTLGTIVAAISVALIVSHCGTSDKFKEQEAAKQAQQLILATPHVIREADSCKVYEFYRDNSPHYFTRCGDTVTTDRQYTQTCGKSCTTHKTETIITKENK